MLADSDGSLLELLERARHQLSAEEQLYVAH